jgi:hypothetical protein
MTVMQGLLSRGDIHLKCPRLVAAKAVLDGSQADSTEMDEVPEIGSHCMLDHLSDTELSVFNLLKESTLLHHICVECDVDESAVWDLVDRIEARYGDGAVLISWEPV